MKSEAFELDEFSAVIHCDAGATWEALEAFLADAQLTVGPLPSWVARSPVRGVIEQSQVLRPSPFYGPLRESVLATEMETPRGIARCPVAPRRAMGPDLPRVAYGRSAAGRITRLSIQCWPRPSRIERVGYVAADWAAIERLTTLWRDEGLRPSWSVFFPADEGPCLMAEIEERAIPLEAWDHCVNANGYQRIARQTIDEWAEQNMFGSDAAQPELVTREGMSLVDAVAGVTDFRGWAVRPDGITLDSPMLTQSAAAGWQVEQRALIGHLEATP